MQYFRLLCFIVIANGTAVMPGAFALGSEPAGESQTSLFASRVAASEKIQSAYRRLTQPGVKNYERLCRADALKNRMLTYREFMEVLLLEGESMPQEDFSGIYWMFREVQQPLISKPELLATIQSWNDGIHSVTLQYTVASSGGTSDISRSQSRFAAEKSKLLWDHTTWNQDDKPRRRIQAYDGDSYRYVEGFGQETLDNWNTGLDVMARTHPLDTLNRFSDPWNPLTLVGIFDDVKRFNGTHSLHQYVSDWSLYETTKSVNDQECICVGNEYGAYYLGIQKGFAVVANRLHHFSFDRGRGKVYRGDRHSELNASEFYAATEGLWIPKRVTRVVVDGPSTTATEVTIDRCEINKPVRAADFTDVIPPGALVSEPGNARMHKFPGPSANEEEKKLPSHVRHKTGSYRWLIAVNLVALALLALSVYIRLRRRSGGPQ